MVGTRRGCLTQSRQLRRAFVHRGEQRVQLLDCSGDLRGSGAVIQHVERPAVGVAAGGAGIRRSHKADKRFERFDRGVDRAGHFIARAQCLVRFTEQLARLQFLGSQVVEHLLDGGLPLVIDELGQLLRGLRKNFGGRGQTVHVADDILRFGWFAI